MNEAAIRRKNSMKKKLKIFNPYLLYCIALWNFKRTISEKLLDKPELLQGSPVIF